MVPSTSHRAHVPTVLDSPFNPLLLATPAQLLGSFIPSFANTRVALVNLDLEAQMAYAQDSTIDPRCFADAATCSRFVDELHQRLLVDASLGGYMEDRSFLWQGTYLGGTGHELHLGIDFNVPASTPIVVPFGGVVLRCDDDSPEPWGWGPRVFVETFEYTPSGDAERYVYAFAHLADIGVQTDQILGAHTEIAVVGAAPTNGNWFPHLHVQKMRGEIYDHYLSIGIDQLDGYGSTRSVEQNMRDFPNPFSFLLNTHRLG